ncbi:MAG: aminopeptidase [Cytophagales bacterium]|nr:aminopeptidase [Cytophagales bacterium]
MQHFKKIIFSALIILLALTIWQYELISYALWMGYGQFKILYKAIPVAEATKDGSFPDSLKVRLQIVEQVRAYAIDSLGINDSENYTTVFDQKGKPVLWVLTACPPYKLKPYEWQFPLLGSFSYKGFFDHEKALGEEEKLKKEGYDTDVREAEGWSTLGWFKDPILSNMLLKSEGELASIIIHELTHATLYIKNDVEFNENLANFVGDKGALLFLKSKYGKDSRQYHEYNNNQADRKKIISHILDGAIKLDSLYSSYEVRSTNDEVSRVSGSSVLRHLKTRLIKQIVQNIDTISFNSYIYEQLFNEDLPNNTFFMSIKRYNEKRNIFEEEYSKKFDSDMKTYLEYLKNKFSY